MQGVDERAMLNFSDLHPGEFGPWDPVAAGLLPSSSLPHGQLEMAERKRRSSVVSSKEPHRAWKDLFSSARQAHDLLCAMRAHLHIGRHSESPDPTA
jgi:hypothetical protein